ncbi:hypothetical protein [Sandarakinorhabdus sp.]|uniref:hypothetical protein n=1 Tax=Sandarakinorhabdus sp. TaxID=1916663 RepID=UPI00333E57F3
MFAWINDLFGWFVEKLSGAGQAKAAITELYRQTLLDNVMQPCKQDSQIQARLAVLQAQLQNKDGWVLGELYSIESELWTFFDDATVLARFWSVRDRFERVATAVTRANYALSVPAGTDDQWKQPEFLRSQALALIDAVQNSQLVSLEREFFTNSLRTTMFSIGITLAGIMLVLMLGVSLAARPPLMAFYAILFALGMMGACVSYVRRLHAAVDHNALVGDGLSELNTIANNRVTAFSTVLIGGVFAIITYWLVLSSAFAALIPTENDQPGLSTSTVMAETMLAGARAELATLESQQAKPAPAVDGATEVAAQAAAGSAPSPELVQKRADILKLEVDIARMRAELNSLAPKTSFAADCTKPANVKEQSDCTPSFGTRSASAMELADAHSFYLMLVLAFLAGFAEQFVPDALDRLTRRMTQRN